MTKLSVIIPTKDRLELLYWHLEILKTQTLLPELWELVIVNDGGKIPAIQESDSIQLISYEKNTGPATARNIGAQEARNEILVFVGDDCIPDRNFLWRHWYRHNRRASKEWFVLQGMTAWHPNIPPDDFMNFLVSNGLQANWPALKDENGNWKTTAPGWFLTTNASISKELFDSLGGFDESFPHAAWEDVELGYRIAKHNITPIFDPDAINFHYHRYSLDQFAARQLVEGESRLYFCTVQPEISGSMLDPKGLRESTYDDFVTALESARELHYNRSPELQEIRMRRWGIAMRLASLEGIRRGINKRGGIWRAIPHISSDEICRHLVASAAAMEKSDLEYAQFEMELAVKSFGDSWAVHMAYCELLIILGRRQEAIVELGIALEKGAGELWPLEVKKRLE